MSPALENVENWVAVQTSGVIMTTMTEDHTFAEEDPAMRTIVDIPERDLALLDRLRGREKASRAEIIRRAIRNYLVRMASGKGEEIPGFGRWGRSAPDGVALQRSLHAEWKK